VRSDRIGDLAGEPCDLVDERAQRRDQREHDPAARADLGRAGAPAGRAAQARQQLVRAAATAVVLALQERGQALVAKSARVRRARIARQKGQRDRAVDLKEDPDRARPEALELAAQLVGERDP
jgi:hypothetical protein